MKHQTSSIKHQGNSKQQASIALVASQTGVWKLKVPWCLKVEFWNSRK